MGEKPHPVPKFNRSSGEGDKPGWEGRREAGLGGGVGLDKGSGGVRGNTRYLEREDWCRTSDTGDKHWTSCPFKIFGGRLWVKMRGMGI